MAPVTGQVTHAGAPVPDAIVSFRPQAAEGQANAATRPAQGLTDAEGNYFLSTKVDNDGAAVGKHKVSVSSKSSTGKLPGALPRDFEVEVKAGDNAIDLDLK